jgi:hypothetical protein
LTLALKKLLHLYPIQRARARRKKLEENWSLLWLMKNNLIELFIIKIVTPAARTPMKTA